MRSGRPAAPQRLDSAAVARVTQSANLPLPEIPGDPFDAAERFQRRAWDRLRAVRQWSKRKIKR